MQKIKKLIAIRVYYKNGHKKYWNLKNPIAWLLITLAIFGYAVFCFIEGVCEGYRDVMKHNRKNAAEHRAELEKYKLN